jgi:hypothetical protein
MLIAAVLAACGIDQGGIERPPEIPQLTVISGPITGFGSIHVNGIALDASTAQIRIDSAPAVEADLRRGQIIRALALVGAGANRALSIEHQTSIVGPIDALDVSAGTLHVLGQRVVVNAVTALDLGQSATVANLAQSESVAVSGLRTPTGDLLATYIGRAPGAAPRITGSITAANAAGLTFAIGGLTVDYSQVTMLQVTAGVPQPGGVVEVTGTIGPGGTLVAAQVRTPSFAADTLAASATALSPLETPIAAAATTSAPSAASFFGLITASATGTVALADVDVSINASTAILGGDSNSLRIGVLVLVEGRIVGFGQIAADRITIF